MEIVATTTYLGRQVTYPRSELLMVSIGQAANEENAISQQHEPGEYLSNTRASNFCPSWPPFAPKEARLYQQNIPLFKDAFERAPRTPQAVMTVRLGPPPDARRHIPPLRDGDADTRGFIPDSRVNKSPQRQGNPSPRPRSGGPHTRKSIRRAKKCHEAGAKSHAHR